MAERFIARINDLPERSQNLFTNYTNLGYIPGGTVGLSGLVEAPWEALPYSLDAQEVWGSAPLNTVFSLAGFKLVMVISESPDTSRAWIEQVGPALQAEGTPLLMVVSAQAEPLIQPYYVSKPKQVNGLIAGIAGGVAYESLTGQEGLGRQNWDAFGAGLLVAEMVILVGGIIGLFSSFLADAKKRESKEKA
jgi:hypothetical protein